MTDAPAKDDAEREQEIELADSLQYGATGERLSGSAQAGDDASFDALLRKVAAINSPPAAQLPAIGEVVAGRYRIEERLGTGGMGAVFRATHVISEKQVAVKWMLRPASDEGARRRFVREARAAARIEHPNVVDVYDVGQHGEMGLYMVMQLLRGEPLRARIARGRMAVAEAVDLLLPAMRGVSAVHEAGIVHRDLKPDNVFLCEGRPGVRPEAKVLDFGISAMAAGEANDPTLTRDGAVLGTPAYMSPEQLRDSRSVDVRTDVYAFGVILYEALTGVLPFSADSYNGLVLAIASSTPKSPRALRPDLPFELEQLVLRALAKQREDRYPTVDSLIAALTRYASDPSADSAERGATTARSWLPSLARRSRSRRWRWLAGGLLLALSLALWWFGRTSTGPQAEHEPARVETPEQPAVRSPPAQVPAALGPVLSAEPSPTREVAPPAEPAPLGRTSPRVKKERRPMENAPLPALEHEGAPRTPAPNSARSGKISPDDL